ARSPSSPPITAPLLPGQCTELIPASSPGALHSPQAASKCVSFHLITSLSPLAQCVHLIPASSPGALHSPQAASNPLIKSFYYPNPLPPPSPPCISLPLSTSFHCSPSPWSVHGAHPSSAGALHPLQAASRCCVELIPAALVLYILRKLLRFHLTFCPHRSPLLPVPPPSPPSQCVELIPAALVLYILRKLPPKRNANTQALR
ncbi:unnamed protein product, partial [Closterium sp. NIES-54]